MQILFILISLSLASNVDCESHPIFCKIVSLQPQVDKNQAMEWSNQISQYAKIHEGDPMLAVAIAMQETSLKNISRKGKVIRFYKKLKV